MHAPDRRRESPPGRVFDQDRFQFEEADAVVGCIEHVVAATHAGAVSIGIATDEIACADVPYTIKNSSSLSLEVLPMELSNMTCPWSMTSTVVATDNKNSRFCSTMTNAAPASH